MGHYKMLTWSIEMERNKVFHNQVIWGMTDLTKLSVFFFLLFFDLSTDSSDYWLPTYLLHKVGQFACCKSHCGIKKENEDLQQTIGQKGKNVTESLKCREWLEHS